MGVYDMGTARGTIELDASQLDRAAGSMDFLGRRMVAMGGAAIAGFGYAVKSAADFEQQLSRFQAVANAPVDQMEAIRQKALQLGRDSAYGATEVVNAFAELGYAGASTKEIIDGLGDAVVFLAAAAEIPLADASTTLINTMRQFNIDAADSVDIADELARAANASTITITDLITSLRYAGPVAAALHMPFNDVAETLAILGNEGIRGSTAGTSLRGVLIALTPTSDKAATAMRNLGLITKDGANQFFDAQGRMKSMAEVSQILHDATANLTDQQKKEAFTTIFQRRAMASALVLAKDGAQAFTDLANSNQYNTTAQELMKKKLDNLNGSIKILKASLQTAAITLGEQFTPYIKGLADFIRGLVNAFIKLPAPVKKVLGLLILLSGVFLTLTGGAFIMGSMIIRSYKAWKDFGIAMKILSGIIKGNVIPAIGEMSAALWAFLTNPVVLIIAALILVGIALYELYQHSEAFHKAVDKVWQAIQKGAKWVYNFFKNNWKEILGWILAPGLMLAIKIWQRWGDDIKRIVGAVAGAIKRFGQRVWEDLTHWIGNAINAVVNFFQRLPERIGGAILATIDFIRRMLWQIPMAIAYALGFAIGFFIGFWIDVFKAAWEWIPKIIGAVLKFELDMVLAFVDMGGKIIAAVVGFFTRLPGIIWRALNEAYQFMVNFTVTMIIKAIEVGSKVLSAIIGFFSRLPGEIWRFLVAAYNFMVKWVGDVIAKAIEVGTRVVEAIIRFFSKIPGEITRALSGLPGKMYDIGKNIMQGLLNGLKHLAGKVKDFIGDIGKSIIHGIGKGLKLGSPSKVMFDIGGHVMQGLINGMGKKLKAVEDLVAQTSKTIDAMDASPALTSALRASTVGSGTNIQVGTARPPTTPPSTPPPGPTFIQENTIVTPSVDRAGETLNRKQRDQAWQMGY